MNIRPSEIHFCQDSINDVFDRHSNHAYQKIGETLDALLKDECKISEIPSITVVKRNGVWFTVDNRRLWVFKKLEEQGKCTEISVKQGDEIPARKFTTENGGVSVRIRGDAGGSYWKGTTSSNETTSTSISTTASACAVYRPRRYRRSRWWWRRHYPLMYNHTYPY